MRRTLWLLPLTTSLALSALASIASAEPQVVQTTCDTVSTEPVKVKISFAIMNSGEGTVGKIKLSPIVSEDPPSDGCGLYECGGPEDWPCFGPPGSTIWEGNAPDGSSYVGPGETKDGFYIIAPPEICCFQVNYYAPAILEAFYWESYCFACDRSVQTRTETWGRIKVLYR